MVWHGQDSGPEPASSSEPISQLPDVLNDPKYLSSVLSSLPGVNPDDPALQGALANLAHPKERDEDKGKDVHDKQDKHEDDEDK